LPVLIPEDAGVDMAVMRLQKFLSSAGFCSRRKGETLIVSGKVSVNGIPVTELGSKVDTEKDRVRVDGADVVFGEELVYIALNKPVGFVTSCSQQNDKIVMDLIDLPQRVYPVGRLDKNSTGLLILTNDGRLHHRLSHPSFDHEKEYEVEVKDPISDKSLEKMAKGMPILGGKTRPAEVFRKSSRKFRIILKEGKNRQIRRMVKHVGNEVVRLKRLRISGVTLGRLPEGAWRHLDREEQHELLSKAQLTDS
jgi:23S rRNA pseudouridine2605 synthase/23S rRNA pseudouridine2604 synthase